MKKRLLTVFLLSLIALPLFADAIVTEKGKILRGNIVRADGRCVMLNNADGMRLFPLKEIKGFVRDGEDAVVLLSNGKKESGKYLGSSKAGLVFDFAGGAKTINPVEIKSATPYKRQLFAGGEFGLKNGMMIAGYSAINAQIDSISTGSKIGGVGFMTGAYIESSIYLAPKLSLTFGGSLEYLPTQSAVLVDKVTSIEYGTISADSLRIGMPIGIMFDIAPIFSLGLSVTPSVNVTSVFQSYTTNTMSSVYITHMAFGLRPALEMKLKLARLISIGLTTGYEVLSTSDGLYIELKTGIMY